MKKFNYFLGICCLLSNVLLGQMANDAGPSMTAFEQYPVDLSTGIPNISIPLFVMPTKANEINIPISLKYHPLGLSIHGKRMNNAGIGWNLSYGGEVSRVQTGERDETPWNTDVTKDDDFYSFNFLGNTGKFKLLRNNGILTAKLLESNNILEIEVLHNSIPAVTSLIFYDQNGYMFIFGVHDQGIYVPPSEGGSISLHYSFIDKYYLSQIRDNNNNVLVNFNYIMIESYRAGYHKPNEKDIYAYIDNISVPGIGTIEFSNERNPFTSVIMKDHLGNIIKNYSFVYPSSPLAPKNLKEVVEKDAIDNPIKKYKLFYKPQLLLETQDYTTVPDNWGYPIRIYNGSINSNYYTNDPRQYPYIDTNNGILQKIQYPTGGAVIYDFEINTFSWDERPVEEWDTIQPAFLQLSGRNLINMTALTLAEAKFTPITNPGPFPPTWRTLATFTLNDTKKVFFRFNSSNGSAFLLQKGALQVKTFTQGSSGSNYVNWEHVGLGSSLELSPGIYTLSVNSLNSSGSYSVIARGLKDSIHQGYTIGGFRIKHIAYFEDGNISQLYYHGGASGISPIREISYNYDYFDFPTKSSGFIANGNFFNRDNAIYRNVTVYDTANKGKKCYEFSGRFINGQLPVNSLIGDVIKVKTFDVSNNLVEEENFIYSSRLTNIDTTSRPNVYLKNGWSPLWKNSKKQYLPSGTFETFKSYKYYSNLLMKEESIATSNSTDTLVTKYYYHTGNSPYSKNRIGAVERIEKILEGPTVSHPLSINKIVYSNTWLDPDGISTVNTSYLPQQLQSSKSNLIPETRSRIILYDADNNPLEVMQENGNKKVYIWGYNNTKIIAEIENISYNEIPAYLITEAQTASNGSSEIELLTKLNALRNAPQLQNSFITTYTYKPLVGVLSVTDVRGNKTSYEYDNANRLILVKDHAGNILTENHYHNQPQN